MNEIISSPPAHHALSWVINWVLKTYPGLVKNSFLPELPFMLYSHCSPTFHESISANQLATWQAARMICQDYLCPMFTCSNLHPGLPTKSCLIYTSWDDLACQPGGGHCHCPALLIMVVQIMYVVTRRDPATAPPPEKSPPGGSLLLTSWSLSHVPLYRLHPFDTFDGGLWVSASLIWLGERYLGY